MLTATTQLWPLLGEETPCWLFGFSMGRGFLERFPMSLWILSRSPGWDLLRDIRSCTLRLLSLFHCRSKLQRPPHCGLCKVCLWSVPLFCMEDHLKRHRYMWCTMWYSGKDKKLHPDLRLFLPIWVHRTPRKHIQRLCPYTPQKEPWMTWPGHLGFDDIVLCCFEELLDLMHLPKTNRVKYSF